MSALKNFAISLVKITLAIALALLIVGLIAWGISVHQDKSKAAAQVLEVLPLAIPTKWPTLTNKGQFDSAQFDLMTMWKDGNVYYKFVVTGYPPAIAQAHQPYGFSTAHFILKFYDANGFSLFEHRIEFDSMSRVVDADGKATGLDWRDHEFLTSDIYRSAKQWNLGWGGFPAQPAVGYNPSPSAPRQKPASSPLPRWRNVSLWRTLTKGMSKDDVRRILGEPTKVDEAQTRSYWYYDYPQGGQVEFDSDGRVISWTEP